MLVGGYVNNAEEEKPQRIILLSVINRKFCYWGSIEVLLNNVDIFDSNHW